MRALLPAPSEDVDLLDWYATDWLRDGGVRVNFISSIDGAIAVDGTSRGLQVPGDKVVFSTLRTLADVVVASSGTVLGEKYRPALMSDQRRTERLRRGIAETLPIAVVSASLHLDPQDALFAEAEARTIVLTCADADPGRRRALEQVADVVECGRDRVDPERLRGALAARNLHRVLCEGGPGLFGQLAAAHEVDELCVTVAPTLAGPGSSRMVTGQSWPDPSPGRLVGLLSEDDALFARYRFAR